MYAKIDGSVRRAAAILEDALDTDEQFALEVEFAARYQFLKGHPEMDEDSLDEILQVTDVPDGQAGNLFVEYTILYEQVLQLAVLATLTSLSGIDGRADGSGDHPLVDMIINDYVSLHSTGDYLEDVDGDGDGMDHDPARLECQAAAMELIDISVNGLVKIEPEE